MIESVDCAYFGYGIFYGYEVATEESIRSGCRAAWEYISELFYEPVIDFLNCNYVGLAGDYNSIDMDKSIRKFGVDALFLSQNRENDIQLVIDDLSSLGNSGIREMVDVVLLSNNEQNKLTCAQKWGIFSNINHSKYFGMLSYSSKCEVSFTVREENRREAPKQEDWYAKTRSLREIEENNFLNLSKLVQEDGFQFELTTHHIFKSISDMIKFLIVEMIKFNVSIKKCKNCGKYFAPFRADALYCGQQSPQDSKKTCQEYGKYTTYLEKTRNDEATRLYKQIYNIKNNKVRRCKTSDNPKGNGIVYADFEHFVSEAAKWKSDVKAGFRVEADYIAWLREVKEKKVL